jgi:hypothetical protein
MQKETLPLKSKSSIDLASLSSLASEAAQAALERKRNIKTLKASSAATQLIETAIRNKAYVFIQLRQGAGYRGLPTKLDSGWLTLENADIFGTKQNRHVAELLIQVKDGCYLAHLHFCESQEPSKQFDAGLGAIK